MTRKLSILAAMAATALAGAAHAQSNTVSAAKASGQVGEQADGYMGVRTNVSSAVRAEVEAINIKRRAAYTDLAAQRGVTVKDVAAATGCETLAKRVAPGQAYQLRDGVWRVRDGGGSIALPDYCAS